MNFYSKYVRHLALGAVVVTALQACGSEEVAAPAPGPVEVGVVTLAAEDVVLTTELPGRTTAFRKAEIRPQVTGIIVKRLFEEGSEITEGQQLYQIDDARYKAAYATAQAGLAEAKANLDVARAREQRYKDLVAARAVSQQDYDDALASFRQAEAAIAGAEAAIETARINLEYTRVLAPISGQIGKSAVTEGALVTAGQAQALAVIQQLDPIYVDMSQSVDEINEIRREVAQGNLVRDEAPEVYLSGQGPELTGTLEFAEVDVNQSTGTVTMRAQFANPDNLLLPGMFVRAVVEEGTRMGALLIPQRGVAHNQQGQATVMVVNEQGQAEMRVLQVGRAIGGDWLVLSGVQPGEQVIVEGLQKVQPGAPVKAVPAASGANSQQPQQSGQSPVNSEG